MQALRFNVHYRLLLLLVLSMVVWSSAAQVTGNDPDKVYGYDPLLYNGMVYYYYNSPRTVGNQYLVNDFDQHASVTVRGITYSDVTLNYDILNQLLILKFQNALGSQSLIELSFAWLEKFELNSRHFEVLASADTTKEIYQVLGTGPRRILYFHSKKLLVENLTESTDHFYSGIQRTMYVSANAQKIKYKNNRSFIAAFPASQHDLIRKYLRKHNLIVQKATDSEMTEFINFCNTLTGT